LIEDVYIKVPLGFTTLNSELVCKLQKSLYGLKQASRQWNAKLIVALISLGFHQSSFDYSLFVKNQNSHITILLIYVDDVVLTGNHLEEINFVKIFLDQQFKIKDLGELNFFSWLRGGSIQVWNCSISMQICLGVNNRCWLVRLQACFDSHGT